MIVYLQIYKDLFSKILNIVMNRIAGLPERLRGKT